MKIFPGFLAIALSAFLATVTFASIPVSGPDRPKSFDSWEKLADNSCTPKPGIKITTRLYGKLTVLNSNIIVRTYLETSKNGKPAYTADQLVVMFADQQAKLLVYEYRYLRTNYGWVSFRTIDMDFIDNAFVLLGVTAKEFDAAECS